MKFISKRMLRILKRIFVIACAIFAVMVVVVAILVKCFILPSLTDDELFLFAEKAFSDVDGAVQLEIDELLREEGHVEAHSGSQMCFEEEESKGLARTSKLFERCKMLPHWFGTVRVCRVEANRCLRIRYGWPTAVAEVLLFKSNANIPPKGDQRRINPHAIVFRVIRHV